MLKKTNLFLLTILLLALFLRFYRLDDLSRINYDEAQSLIAERKIIIDKDIVLLGPDDHIKDAVIYFGPAHYYLMLPGILLGNVNPPGTYIWTAFLGSFAVPIVYLTNRKLISAAFYSVVPLAVIHSRMDWLPNDIILFAPLFFLSLVKKHFFWAGLFFGLCLQAHTTAAPLGLFFLPFIIKKRALIFFAIGLAVGLLPMIIFDLKYNFLYLRGYLALFLNGSDKGLFWPHYYLWLTPAIALAIAKLPGKIAAATVSVCLSVTVFWLLASPSEVAINPKTISQISEIIARDVKKSSKTFNVATFTDPNTRGMSYRYYLSLYGASPRGVDQYNSSDLLYVITFEKPKTILKTQVYEISSFSPKKITKSWRVKNSNIYRLEK